MKSGIAFCNGKKKGKRKKRIALHAKQSPMNMNDFFFCVLMEGEGGLAGNLDDWNWKAREERFEEDV